MQVGMNTLTSLNSYERMERGNRLTITATITDYEEKPPNRPP